ncbi:MAG: 2-amino-4-hydroxy-6-hydroxymethyldihydropteridine diphosphokinase [Acidobacteriota bacterium]
MFYYLSLGSNRGNRLSNLKKAIRLIQEKNIELVKSSSFYLTEPVDFKDQNWFINVVLKVRSELKPLEMLRIIKKIEDSFRRNRFIQKGPREIDIDILIAMKNDNESLILNEENLQIPHPKLNERNFVLIPLSEISSDLKHPVLNMTIKDLFLNSKDMSKIRKISK